MDFVERDEPTLDDPQKGPKPHEAEVCPWGISQLKVATEAQLGCALPGSGGAPEGLPHSTTKWPRATLGADHEPEPNGGRNN